MTYPLPRGRVVPCQQNTATNDDHLSVQTRIETSAWQPLDDSLQEIARGDFESSRYLRERRDTQVPAAALGATKLDRMHTDTLGRFLLRNSKCRASCPNVRSNALLSLHAAMLDGLAKSVQSR